MHENRTTAEYGYDVVEVGCRVVGTPPGEDIERARDMAEEACRPLDTETIMRLVRQLRVATRGREDIDVKTAIAYYVTQLRDFPADVVAHVLETQPKASPFWPTWFELQERLDLYSRRRHLLRDALRAA